MKVTVIVPCFDVEEYVDDCIRSLVEQTHRDIEVIAVDDGSTDRSGVLLDAWAESDSRVLVRHQPNGGLGAARNAGLDHATGDGFLFVDGDDFLPPDAVERFVVAASTTGSDLVVGAIDVWRAGERWRATQQTSVYDRDRFQTSLAGSPGLVFDPMACAKLFTRSLWERLDLRFAEGVLFEDVEIVMAAYCGATAIDVVSSPTYFWRQREAGQLSITQQVSKRAISDRFDALRRAHQRLITNGDEVATSMNAQKLIGVDLRRAVRQAAESCDGSMGVVASRAREMIASLDVAEVETAPPMMGLVCRFVERGDVDGLALCEGCFGDEGRSRLVRCTAAIRLAARRPSPTVRLAVAIARRGAARAVTRFRGAAARLRRRP